MTQALSAIQTVVQFEARDDNIDLTSTQGLAVANLVYRRLALAASWPEFTREDTSLSTTAGTEAYTWPASPIFGDVSKVELQDSQNDLKYTVVAPPRTELEWTLERRKKNGFPLMYRRVYNGSNHVIQFAPTPDTGSLTIRITGLVEPTAFTSSSSSTLFQNNAVDEALAQFIAAEIMDQREYPDQAARLRQRGSALVSQVLGRTFLPEEMEGHAQAA